jgi:hypothetical protein
MITNDIVGNTLGQNGVRDRGSIRLFSEGVPSDETAGEASRRRIVGGENDSSSRQLARFMAEAAKGAAGLRVHQVWRRDRFGRGGDHIPFLEAGWPAVRLTEPNEDYRRQHQNVRTENGVDYGDLPDLVDFDYVARVARLNALALAALASAPSPPTRVRIAPGLSPDTMLQWAPSDDPDVTGYEVVWRPTTAPDWSLRRKAGKVATLTLNGVSKDDFQFGVRSVDRHGNRSVVAAAGSR